MTIFIISFVAGVLTVAAPCILPLLPVVVGGSIARTGNPKDQTKNWYRPLVIAFSLMVSVILFTLLLKASTSLLGVPQQVWQVISGGIVILLGLTFLVPKIWEKLALKTGLHTGSNLLFAKSFKTQGLLGDMLVGFSLGPIFSSCSPTYALIVATVLPRSFAEGFLYLLAYSFGLAATLLVIAFIGQGIISKLGWLTNPNGLFKKVIGLLFIAVGLSVIFGLDKKFQTYVLDNGWYDPIYQLEQRLEN